MAQTLGVDHGFGPPPGETSPNTFITQAGGAIPITITGGPNAT